MPELEAIRKEYPATDKLRREVAALRLQSAALEAAGNSIIITDRDGLIVWANPAFTALTGYALAEAIGKNLQDLVKSGEHDRAFYEQMWQSILAGQVWHGELVNRRKDGSLYHEEQTITPVRDAGGAITHFIAIKQDLTVQKGATEALRESEQLLADAQAMANMGTYVLDIPTGRWKSSAALDALFGIDQSYDHSVEGWKALIHPGDRTMMADYFSHEVLGRGQTFNKEYRIIRQSDLAARWVQGFGKLRFDAQGRPIVMRGAIQDITERKRAEEALRQAEAKFHAIFEHAIEGIYQTTPEGKFLAANPAMARILGYASAEQLIAERTDLARESYADPTRREEFQRLMERDSVVEGFESEFLCRDGRRKWISENARAVRDARGRVLYYEGSFEDISERKRAETSLRENEERYRLFFEHNPLPMWLYDLETLRFLAVNDAAVQHYGYSREEFLAMTIKDIGPEEDIPALLMAVEKDGAVSKASAEWRHRRKDGSVIHVEITSRPLVFAGRKARLVLAADITEKKQFEGKLLHAQRLESIGMLAAGIAHDLNNVLSPIVIAGPMLRGSLSAEQDLNILDLLERSAARGAGLVKQILGFANSAAGEIQPTQVKHLARDIIGIIEETFPKAIELEQQIPANLWLVQGNATQIHQVLLNLCLNARDAMPSGGTLRIAATNRHLHARECDATPGSRPGKWLVLEVTDTGTGIAPEVLEHIWTPFFTTKGSGRGTGLGLSTVRGIVANHHGFIELITEVGRGTTIRVFLPAIEIESPRPGSTPSSALPVGHGELILVVDDDAAVRAMVSEILGRYGYRVISCVDGVEAITLFNANCEAISLVVTDADMPRLGGAALAGALLQVRPDLRLLAMSGLSRDELDGDSEAPAIQKLAHAFLHKPFKPEDLLGAVHQLIHPTAES